MEATLLKDTTQYLTKVFKCIHIVHKFTLSSQEPYLRTKISDFYMLLLNKKDLALYDNETFVNELISVIR